MNTKLLYINFRIKDFSKVLVHVEMLILLISRGVPLLDSEAVLNHFINKIQCRGMFSTHYHRLAIDYQDDFKVHFPLIVEYYYAYTKANLSSR